ncbi:MAG: sirohydrochlorin cobaltochelatase [Selenomonadaceae bacterium]|nr:sirohydrochlorin cobaltochelatase [Selenomonadaceae bacterium]
MNPWKKFLIATLATASIFSLSHAEAAYTLNDEVKHPTPALLAASQIGVLKYENPNFDSYMDKDAIVILSFGTTYKETREKTIEATAQAIQNAHKNVKVAVAFTSHIVIDHIKENEGKCDYMTPEQTLDQLKKEGYTRIALVSLDVIPGMEYNYCTGVFNAYKDQFKKMTCSTPLMYWQGQEDQPDDVLEAMKAMEFPKKSKGTATLVLAHGTPNPSNAYYSVMQAKVRDELNRDDIYIYTVEGWPSLEDVIPKLKAQKYKLINLMPLMMVAGDHANNDMAGDEDDSHASILKANGFNVKPILKGIGEYKSIRNLYVDRANEAWDALVK